MESDSNLPSKETSNSQLILLEIKKIRQEVKAGFYDSVGRRFVLGMASGLGTVVGATILVTILLFVLRQFANINTLRPFIEDIIKIVQQSSQ